MLGRWKGENIEKGKEKLEMKGKQRTREGIRKNREIKRDKTALGLENGILLIVYLYSFYFVSLAENN